MEEILDAIILKINSKYPEYTKYLFEIGEGFERPSFFVYLISAKQDHINKKYYKQNLIIQIVYFDKLDAYSNPSRLRQLEVSQNLLEIFSNISLKTVNGYLDIEDVFADFTADNNIFVQITLNKYKERHEDLSEFECMSNLEFDL